MSTMKAVVNQLLTNASLGIQIPDGIVEKIFPTIKAAGYTGSLAKYGKNHLRVENSIKGGRGKYRRVDTQVSTVVGYHIEGHGLEGFVSKEDYINKTLPFDAERDEVTALQTMLLIEKELTVAQTIMNSSIITNGITLSGTSQFNDYVNSDPVGQVLLAQNAMTNRTGNQPNTAVMDRVTFNTLRLHPKFLQTLGYTQARPGGLQESELAQVLGVQKLFVSGLRYNTSKEGQADVLAPVWGKGICFLYAPDSAAPYQQSAGYLVVPDGSTPRKVYKQDNFNPPGSTLILCEDEYDILVSDLDSYYLISGAIA